MSGFKCMTGDAPSAELAIDASSEFAGNATRAYNVNKELGVTGKGVAVGVIDTGAPPC